MKVLCLVLMQHKMASCKEDAMDMLNREGLLRSKNYKVKISVGIKEVWKTLTAVLKIGAGPNILKGSCLLRAWAKHAVAMKATRLRSAASTQLALKDVVLLKVPLG